MNKDYTIGIYIRLSMADEDTGSGSKAESARMTAIPGQIFIVLSSRR